MKCKYTFSGAFWERGYEAVGSGNGSLQGEHGAAGRRKKRSKDIATHQPGGAGLAPQGWGRGLKRSRATLSAPCTVRCLEPVLPRDLANGSLYHLNHCGLILFATFSLELYLISPHCPAPVLRPQWSFQTQDPVTISASFIQQLILHRLKKLLFITSLKSFPLINI